jgi:hypothetical protein
MSDFISNFIGRLDGPLHFRFYAQPLMAIVLAIRDGRQDAREGRPFYAWTVFTDPVQRRQLLLDGWKRISRVFLIALAIDFAYQLIVRHGFQPLEALWVALLLAILPYMAFRGPANRLLRRRYPKGSHRGEA